MSEEMWNDVGLVHFLLKILDTFEVGAIFLLVGCSRKRDVDMFSSDPFIKVIFNLKEVNESETT
jgi:hypothetical protein